MESGQGSPFAFDFLPRLEAGPSSPKGSIFGTSCEVLRIFSEPAPLSTAPSEWGEGPASDNRSTRLRSRLGGAETVSTGTTIFKTPAGSLFSSAIGVSVGSTGGADFRSSAGISRSSATVSLRRYWWPLSLPRWARRLPARRQRTASHRPRQSLAAPGAHRWGRGTPWLAVPPPNGRWKPNRRSSTARPSLSASFPH